MSAHINDIGENECLLIRLFAEDTLRGNSTSSIEDLQLVMNHALNKFSIKISIYNLANILKNK